MMLAQWPVSVESGFEEVQGGACMTDEGSEFQLLLARTLRTCLQALDVAWGLNSFQG